MYSAPETASDEIANSLVTGALKLSSGDARLAAGFTHADAKHCCRLVTQLWSAVVERAELEKGRFETEYTGPAVRHEPPKEAAAVVVDIINRGGKKPRKATGAKRGRKDRPAITLDEPMPAGEQRRLLVALAAHNAQRYYDLMQAKGTPMSMDDAVLHVVERAAGYWTGGGTRDGKTFPRRYVPLVDESGDSVVTCAAVKYQVYAIRRKKR